MGAAPDQSPKEPDRVGVSKTNTHPPMPRDERALRVDEAPLQLLGIDEDLHFAAQFFMTPRAKPDEQAPYSVMRRRLIDHVWLEEITVMNYRVATSEVRVVLEVDTDFADLFEVKDGVVAEPT